MTAPRTYAGETTVPVELTLAEIQALLAQRGAVNIATGRRDRQAPPIGWVSFSVEAHDFLLRLPLPVLTDPSIAAGPNGKARTEEQARRALAQRERAAWRALLLSMRGRFVSIDAGISTLAREFLGDMVYGGRTIADAVLPAVEGKGQTLLLDLMGDFPKAAAR